MAPTSPETKKPLFRFFRASFRNSFRTSSLEDSKHIDPNAKVAEDEQVCCDDDILRTVQQEDWYQSPLMVLVVGASGDLAKKKTYPALYELYKAKLLPSGPTTVIWGFARTKKTHEELRDHIKPYLMKGRPDEEEPTVDAFLQMCYYRNGKSYGDSDVLHTILQEQPGQLHNLLVYLAIPPDVFGTSCQAVKTALKKLQKEEGIATDPWDDAEDPTSVVPGFCRVVLEKPFGRDTASCEALLKELQDQHWQESALYRIDHYLGKEMVQNILQFRKLNPWLTPLWGKDAIQSVHLIFKEPFGTDGRGGYFDPYGIIRDILQNHLLQVLSLVAMEIPEESAGEKQESEQERIRNAKVEVLKNMPVITINDCLLGQYNGYKDDPTIENKDTNTPTYAAIRAQVNTETWKGVPFVMEAGKALDERLCEVRMHFKEPPTSSAKSQQQGYQNALVMRLQPKPSIFLTANLKTPGFSQTAISTHMGFNYDDTNKIPDAYTRLLLDVMRGQQASFVRDDELTNAWELFTPVLHHIERSNVKPLPYDLGSTGPEGRDDFFAKAGVTKPWLPPPAAL